MDNIAKIVNDFGESIVRVDGDIPVGVPAKDGDRFLFINHDQSFLTHGLHKYPAKFFPNCQRYPLSTSCLYEGRFKILDSMI